MIQEIILMNQELQVICWLIQATLKRKIQGQGQEESDVSKHFIIILFNHSYYLFDSILIQ
jgi:hypothetical protein